jgi:SAM-dependent methyltransferase
MPADEDRCPWCGTALPPAERGVFHVKHCPTCGVGVTRPRPSADDLAAAYGPAYRPPEGRFLGLADALLRRTRSALARRIDAIAPPGRVLDIGAGDGTLLAALRARGREAVGLERAGRQAAPDIRDADIEDLDGGWAAIVLWHSLEHLPEPARVLAAAAERLAPGGVLIVAVPNLDSIQARMFGERWLALDLPRHLVHLPAPALVDRLRTLGLDVERVSHWRGGQVAFGWLHGLVAALPGHRDLYDALRLPEARLGSQPPGERRAALALGALCAPVALASAAVEIAVRRGGSVHVEARRS